MRAILFLQTWHKNNGFVPNVGEIFLFVSFVFIYLFFIYVFCFFQTRKNQQLKFMCLPESHESFFCLGDAINYLSNKYKNCS